MEKGIMEQAQKVAEKYLESYNWKEAGVEILQNEKGFTVYFKRWPVAGVGVNEDSNPDIIGLRLYGAVDTVLNVLKALELNIA